MGDMPSLEERVRRLELAVAELAARLPARGVEDQPAAAEAAPASLPPDFLSGERWQGVPALVGRTFLALGGAFLIRSVTESGLISGGVGVSLGVVYALAWLFLADRAAAGGRHLSGAFHALAAALIAFPLLVEATARWRLLSAPLAALLLAFAAAAGLAVAWRHRFRTIAWITEVAALASATALLFRARSVLPMVLVLLALAVASLVLAYGRGWRGQRWLVALAVDAVVLLLGLLAILPRHPVEWLAREALLMAQLGLAGVYLGAFVLRLGVQRREVTGFAITQTLLVLAIGLEGALWIAAANAARAIGAVALLGGAALSVAVLRRRQVLEEDPHALAYFSCLATVLMAEGIRATLAAPWYAVVWAFLGLAAAEVSRRWRAPIVAVQSVLLLAAAGFGSGLLAAAYAALARPASGPWSPFTPYGFAVLGLAALTAILVGRGRYEGFAAVSAPPTRGIALAVSLVGLGGAVVSWLGQALAEAPGEAANPGRLAALRAAVGVVAALALAYARRRGAGSEFAALAIVVLVLLAVKLLVEDLRLPGAGHLVASLTLCGAALITVPALLRKGTTST